MLYVHGGSFQTGSGSDPEFDGTTLAEATGNIVIS